MQQPVERGGGVTTPESALKRQTCHFGTCLCGYGGVELAAGVSDL